MGEGEIERFMKNQQDFNDKLRDTLTTIKLDIAVIKTQVCGMDEEGNDMHTRVSRLERYKNIGLGIAITMNIFFIPIIIDYLKTKIL